jgi:transcriptional regulator with XRE-family HTH domain
MRVTLNLYLNQISVTLNLLGGAHLEPIYVRVEKVRVSRGVTKTHLARACNKTVAWYSDVSKGKIRLTVDDLEKIANALNVDVKIFFKEKLSVTHNSA